MPWANDPETRRRNNATYGTEWKRQRRRALDRDGHRCQQCGSGRRLQVDHISPVSAGGADHSLTNLRTLCETCHLKVTAQQGGGYRNRTAKQDPAPSPRTQW